MNYDVGVFTRRRIISPAESYFAVPSTVADSAAMTQFLARITTPDASHKAAYAALVDGLVADGVWTKLDALYIFAAADSTTAKVNLKQSAFGCISHGTVSFTADHGFTGNATDFFLETQFTPSTAAGNFAQHSASYGVYVTTSSTANSNIAFGSFSLFETQFNLAPNAGFVIYNLNGAVSNQPTIANVQGSWVVSIPSSGTLKLYKNATGGAAFDTTSVSATGLDNTSLAIFARGTGSGTADSFFFAREISAAFIGGGLSDTEVGNVSARINTYMTTLTINVY